MPKNDNNYLFLVQNLMYYKQDGTSGFLFGVNLILSVLILLWTIVYENHLVSYFKYIFHYIIES